MRQRYLSEMTTKTETSQSDLDRQLLTSADAARLADVTPNTVRGWTASGALRSMSTPSGQRLIQRADLDAYIETREQCQPKS